MPLRIVKSDGHGKDRELGLQAFHEGRWLDVIAYLEGVTDDEPSDYEAMNALALAHDSLGDGKVARTILNRAAEASPDYPPTFRNLSLLLSKQGRLLEAADNACRAVELDPSDSSAIETLEAIRAQVRAMKPVIRKKNGKQRGPTQTDIDSRLARVNKTLRSTVDSVPEVADPSGGKATISLCMIAKDEEDFIGDCLKSVRGLVDEIVILDTGSQDRTIQIAESHGAHIHRGAWTDSYADARNKALEHATCDWILILDADERLDKDSRKVIAQAIRNPSADAFALYFRNYTSADDETDYFVHRTCRLVRNRSEYRFTGRIHESIIPSIESSGGKVGDLDAVIHHYGYRPDMMDRRRKLERYLRLLHAELDENPQDPFCLYNLGTAYSTNDDFENAVIYLEQASGLVTPMHEFAAAVYSKLEKSLTASGKPSHALTHLEKAEEKGIRHPELRFAKGNALLMSGRFEEAVVEFLAAIREGQNGKWIGDPGAFGYKAYYGIAQAYAGLGDFNSAIEFCRRVLAQKPNDLDAHQLMSTAYVNLGRLKDAEKCLRESLSISPENADAMMLMADLHQHQGRYREALDIYLKLADLKIETSELWLKTAVCMQFLDKLEEAETNYLHAIRLDEGYVEAHTGLGLLYSQQGRANDSLESFAKAVDIDPTFSDAYFYAADLLFSLQKYVEAADVYQSGLAHDAGNARGFLSLGNCYFRMGAHDAAVIAYKQALTIDPNYAEASSNLAVAQQAVSKKFAA